MAYRLLNIPMNESEYKKEEKHIHDAARINGFGEDFVKDIIRKHQDIRHTRRHTTLAPIASERRIVCLPFFPKVTNPLSTALKRHGIHIVTRNNNTTRDLLCNLKDTQLPTQTSGIYEISCKDCDEIYIGQSKRAIKERFKEHVSATNNGHAYKTSVSEHMIENNHTIDVMRRTKYVRDEYKLDAWESLYMMRERNLMNREPPPIPSYLFRLTHEIRR